MGCNFNILINYTNTASRVFSQRDVHLSLLELLLNHAKCDVNIADNLGWTPLYQAAYNGEIGKRTFMRETLLPHDA